MKKFIIKFNNPSPMIFDTHAHIHLCDENKQEQIIKNIIESDCKIINVATDLESSQICLDLSTKYDFIFPSIGIHPLHIKDYSDLDDTFIKLEKLYLENKEKIVAIGETGLDYFHIDENNLEAEKQNQKIGFEAQIKLAMKYDLPVIIHSRNAFEDLFEIIQKTGLKKFVMHCYSENLEKAKQIIEYSPLAKISFSGIVTYKKSLDTKETRANIPLENILIETDCPYLTPQIYRGTDNEPSYVVYILEEIISLRTEDKDIISNQIYQNSLDFFNIK